MNEAAQHAVGPLNEAMDVHGSAMLDYLNGERDAAVIMHRDDGFTYPPICAERWFYKGGFPIIDTKALSLCKGTVLNIGASSGSHSLFLEELGLRVISLDASPQAVEVMRRRIVKDPVVGDLDSLQGPFDSILLLCGLGVTGSIDGVRRFLERAKGHLNPGGVIITDCTHPRADSLEASQRYCDLQAAQGRYEGERTLRFEYKGVFGPWFRWLSIAPEALKAHAKDFGFKCTDVYSELGRSLCVLSHIDDTRP